MQPCLFSARDKKIRIYNPSVMSQKDWKDCFQLHCAFHGVLGICRPCVG
uniref:Uncharacterized protein n=1 Tax=Anguilla anguilla TaxID=7936 RepID=A0A0E9U5T0_ANGAN